MKIANLGLVGLIAIAILVLAFSPTGFGAIHISDSNPTAVPALKVNQNGAGKIVEFLDGGTPVFSVNNGGAARGYVNAAATPNKLENCWSSTITGTASYTSNITAIATPEFAWCNLSSPSADANVCGAAVGSGIVTITVRNSAATPVANSAGATVYSCAKGTP